MTKKESLQDEYQKTQDIDLVRVLESFDKHLADSSTISKFRTELRGSYAIWLGFRKDRTSPPLDYRTSKDIDLVLHYTDHLPSKEVCRTEVKELLTDFIKTNFPDFEKPVSLNANSMQANAHKLKFIVKDSRNPSNSFVFDISCVDNKEHNLLKDTEYSATPLSDKNGLYLQNNFFLLLAKLSAVNTISRNRPLDFIDVPIMIDYFMNANGLSANSIAIHLQNILRISPQTYSGRISQNAVRGYDIETLVSGEQRSNMMPPLQFRTYLLFLKYAQSYTKAGY